MKEGADISARGLKAELKLAEEETALARNNERIKRNRRGTPTTVPTCACGCGRLATRVGGKLPKPASDGKYYCIGHWRRGGQETKARRRYVYVVESAGLIRVGRGEDVATQLEADRFRLPTAVRLIASFEVPYLQSASAEQDLRDALHDRHDHGEWYQVSDRELLEVAEAAGLRSAVQSADADTQAPEED